MTRYCSRCLHGSIHLLFTMRSAGKFMVPRTGFSYDLSYDWCVRNMKSLSSSLAWCRGNSEAYISLQSSRYDQAEAPLCRTLRAQPWLASSPFLFCFSHCLASFLQEHFLNNYLHTNLCLRVCCWGTWPVTPKKEKILMNLPIIISIFMNLPFKIDVEIGSHDKSFSSHCRHTNSSINHGCNGTSMKESSCNRRDRNVFE